MPKEDKVEFGDSVPPWTTENEFFYTLLSQNWPVPPPSFGIPALCAGVLFTPSRLASLTPSLKHWSSTKPPFGALVLPFATSVTLLRLLSLSVPHFPYLKLREVYCFCMGLSWGPMTKVVSSTKYQIEVFTIFIANVALFRVSSRYHKAFVNILEI